MPDFIVRTFVAFRRGIQTPAVLEFCLGILAATHAFLWLSWFTGTWGVSLTIVAALAVSFGVAALLSDRFDVGGIDARFLRAGAQFLLAGWTLAMPGLLALSVDSIRGMDLEAVARPAVRLSIIPVAALLLMTPGWIVLLQTLKPARTGETRRQTGVVSPWALLGGAGTLFLMPITLAVTFDLQSVGWTASGIGVVIGVAMCRRSRDKAIASTHHGQDKGIETTAPAAPGRRRQAGDVWVGLLAGVALALASQVTGQLVVDSAWVSFSKLAGVTGGIATGMWLRRRRTHAGDGAPIAGSYVIAFAAAALVVLFPQLTTAALRISANVPHTLSIFLLRGGMLSACLFPFGVAIGLHLAGASGQDANAHCVRSLRSLAIAAFAFASARAMEIPVSTGMTVTMLAAGTALAACWLTLSKTHDRRRLVAPTALLAPLVASCLWTSRFDPGRSARILFSPNALPAYRGGTSADQLHLIDDGRLVEEFHRDGVTWTTWMHAGRQLVVRQNGLSRGASSLDSRLCPEVSTEMLPAVLPLVLHPAPRQVTLVGIGGTTALSACLAFPVSRVTCVEPHQGLLAVARQCGTEGMTLDPFDDPRLRVVCTESTLAAAVRQSAQDVIILNRGQASLWDVSAEFTTDRYRRLADHLAHGGLLCQRLHYGDLGARSIRDLAATLQAVFPQVVLIETGPGEIMFIASRSAEPIVDSDVLDRASKPHVRALLSRLGWDWSVLLTMASVDAAGIRELADSEPARANTVVSGRFTFQLPADAARWSPKQEEVNDLLGARSTRLFALIDDETGVQDLLLRLADVNERQRILEEHPDVFWAYRDALRSRLQKRPRMTIRQVGYEGLGRALHPEDERRKAYLLALNDAATQSAPDADALDRLERFTEPYDPLVNYFVHHELARLYARAEVPDPGAELTHRLHTVFYGSDRDQSVRNVSEAIDLIIEQPQVLPDSQHRWDTLNALLEVLTRRWQLRSRSGEASRYDAADVNSSFNSADKALDVMDELAAEAAISPADWRIRRSLLEQHLIRPLRNHRSEQRK